MTRLLTVLLGIAALPARVAGQADPFAPARLSWTEVNVAVVPDSISGVTVWIITTRVHEGAQFQYGNRFDPRGIPSWASQAESLLADAPPLSDTVRWATPPTLVSPDGGLLGWQRLHTGGRWASRVFLVFYPRPNAIHDSKEPIDLDLSLPDAREFLDSLEDKARVSTFVPDTTVSSVFMGDHVQVKPEVLKGGPVPHYPQSLRDRGIEGQVWLEIIIDTLGLPEPRTLKVLSADDPLFEAEAVRAILGTRFKPARVAGKAVRVAVMLPVNFTLFHR